MQASKSAAASLLFCNKGHLLGLSSGIQAGSHVGQAWQRVLHLRPAAETHVLICGLHEGVGQRVLQPLLVRGCTMVPRTQPHTWALQKKLR